MHGRMVWRQAASVYALADKKKWVNAASAVASLGHPAERGTKQEKKKNPFVTAFCPFRPRFVLKKHKNRFFLPDFCGDTLLAGPKKEPRNLLPQ